MNALDRRFSVAVMMDWNESLVFFNWLEGGVCTLCAPVDQRKSRDNQREQAELNSLQSATGSWQHRTPRN